MSRPEYVSHAEICRETRLKRPHATWRMGGLRGHLLPGMSILKDAEVFTCICCMTIDRPLQFQGADYDGPPYARDMAPSRDHLYERDV